MNIGENFWTKSFPGPSTISTSLQLRTRLLLTNVLQAGIPGVTWQWWLGGFAALLCGAGEPPWPDVPQVYWSAEGSEPVQLVVMLLFSGDSQPELARGPVLAEELLLVQLVFCLTGFLSWLSAGPRERVPVAVPEGLGYP